MADGGHSFVKKTFHKPTYCHHCSDLLWGLIGQGCICEVCNFIVHERCVSGVVTPCSGIAPSIIKNPVAHCWSEPTHHKRKFCTVCRKRLDETPAVHCMICEYFAHVECQDFAVADCKENATYIPGKDLSSVKHQHHWREGNLPQTSKCAYCKKTCWSSECLTGYRCEWCGFTTHGGCRNNIPSECTFGILQPIYLPPHAVSIPRTEVPMEAIIGVQIKTRTILTRDYSCPELRTIGLCDATDSELSIQHLDINSKENFLRSTNVNNNNNNNNNNNSKTNNNSNRTTGQPYNRFLLPPGAHQRYSSNRQLLTAEDQPTVVDDRLTKSDTSISVNNIVNDNDRKDYELNFRDIILDINNISNRLELELNKPNKTGNNKLFTRKSSTKYNTNINNSKSSSNNNSNNNNNNNSCNSSSNVNDKPHSIPTINYLRASDATVARSKSFQGTSFTDDEFSQIQSYWKNSRYYRNRNIPHFKIFANDDDDDDDDDDEDDNNLYMLKDSTYNLTAAEQRRDADNLRTNYSASTYGRGSGSIASMARSKNDTVQSGHIMGRIMRRMKKISLGWRKSRCKVHRARSISEEFSSGDAGRFRDDDYMSKTESAISGSTHSKSDSTHKSDKDKDKKDKEKEDKDEETLKVFDGNCSVRRKIFRVITVPRTCNLEHLLTVALRAFHIAKDYSLFYLTDMYAPGGEEIRLQDPNPVLSLHRIEGKRLAIFLRFKDRENDKGTVRVYPGKLQLHMEESFVTLPVDNDTSVKDLIREALNKFDLQDNPIEDYRCSEVLLDRGVTERVLGWNERPWEIMKQLGKDSIRQMELMRFYLQHKQDPHGPNLALFVGNLPPGLSQRNYEQMLLEFLSGENKFSSIGPIYYEYGSVVITYEDAEKAVNAFYTLRDSKYEEKHLLVLLLPNIEPSMVPQGVQPLLVFVNVKSGGCQGLELISSFRKLLNPYQVFDLDNGGPLPGLYVFRHIKDYKILVCGGDGTIGWVLQCLDNVGQDSECSSPPCAIVPLGTGNDLARVLRWGPGYTGGEDPLNLLRDVIDAEEIRLDRWTVVFHPEDKPEDSAQKAPSNSAGKKKKVHQAQPSQQKEQHHHAAITTTQTQVGGTQSEDNSQIFVMNNYFGIGIDADLCLDFHNAREENPNKFNSRLHNKGVYVKMGLRKMVGRKMVKELHKELRLEVDGKVVDLPPVEGIIILNILSWGSGANPWGPEKEDQFTKPNHWDGMLEVVGVTGVVHLGQIQSGLRSAMRIAQGGHIKIHLHSDIPVQVDGEPWVQSPGDVVVLKSALKATMLKKLKGKMKRRNTEPTMAIGPTTPLTLSVTPHEEEPTENSSNNTDF